MNEVNSVERPVGHLRPAPAEWQKLTEQSRLSSGAMWKRCYLCPSLYRCGKLEMCEEEMPPPTRLQRLLARFGLSPNTTMTAAPRAVD